LAKANKLLELLEGKAGIQVFVEPLMFVGLDGELTVTRVLNSGSYFQ